MPKCHDCKRPFDEDWLFTRPDEPTGPYRCEECFNERDAVEYLAFQNADDETIH